LPSADFTLTSPAFSTDASPRSASILFFLNRKSTPAEPFSETVRERLMIVPQSNSREPILKPNSAARCFIVWNNSAFLSSALVGMQPQLLQVPP